MVYGHSNTSLGGGLASEPRLAPLPLVSGQGKCRSIVEQSVSHVLFFFGIRCAFFLDQQIFF